MKYLIALMLVASTVPAIASEALARSNNCLACHAAERKLVGPSFKDIAGRYSEKDIAQVAASIRRGGAGKWGAIPMPAYSRLSEADAAALSKWILEHK